MCSLVSKFHNSSVNDYAASVTSVATASVGSETSGGAVASVSSALSTTQTSIYQCFSQK
jgi:hypothetical protein